VAAAGIDQFLNELLPGLLTHADPRDVAGTLFLEATNEHRRWSVDLDARGETQPSPRPMTVDTSLPTTTSDLLSWLTNRKLYKTSEVRVSQASLASRSRASLADSGRTSFL
jgi:hypothetical protein